VRTRKTCRISGRMCFSSSYNRCRKASRLPLKICAISDLHGRLPKIPDCQVLILAGDICPDIASRQAFHDPELMKLGQMRWLHEEFEPWERTWPDSVRICLATPGNHDWITEFPASCRTKLYIDEGVEAYGKKFYFTPWVSPCGPWNYQLERENRAYFFNTIPTGLDLLVSHSPAHNVGDKAYGDVPSGCPEMRATIYRTQPRFCVFGHIHEGRRYGYEWKLGQTVMYNVAMWGVNWKPTVFDI
jgi:Icc-related predicted phosphoesterase